MVWTANPSGLWLCCGQGKGSLAPVSSTPQASQRATVPLSQLPPQADVLLFPISDREHSSRDYHDCCSPTKVGLPATNEVLLTLTLAVLWKWPCDSEVQLLLQRAGQLLRVFSVKKFGEEIGMCVVAH